MIAAVTPPNTKRIRVVHARALPVDKIERVAADKAGGSASRRCRSARFLDARIARPISTNGATSSHPVAMTAAVTMPCTEGTGRHSCATTQEWDTATARQFPAVTTAWMRASTLKTATATTVGLAASSPIAPAAQTAPTAGLYSGGLHHHPHPRRPRFLRRHPHLCRRRRHHHLPHHPHAHHHHLRPRRRRFVAHAVRAIATSACRRLRTSTPATAPTAHRQ